jgi:RNA polymerase sigma-70 factor (ECF subfamily)
MNRFTDEQLMTRVAEADDVAAFEILYDRHCSLALRVARRLCNSPELANEAVQDAFLSIWRGRDRYDAASGTFASWAMTVVRNRSIDRIRKEAGGVGRVPLDDELLATLSDGRAATEDEVDRNDQVRRVRERLDALPRAQREAVVLSFYGGLSHGQIATRLALPVGTVKGRMRLALAKLADGLARETAPV